MDINLPLILMVAVAFTGLVWLVDIGFLASRRASDDKEPLLIEYSKSFFPVLAVVFVLRSFILEPFKIPSESMVPTLEVGDFIVVNKFTYGIRLPVFRNKILDVNQPKRGDVVVFFPPHKDLYYIKRLVGLSGDKISVVNNILFVNGKPMAQELVDVDPKYRKKEPRCNGEYQLLKETIDGVEHLMRKCSTHVGLGHKQTWTVPDGHYFMMGDNRDNSADSRSPGWTQGAFVPDKNIVGKAFAIWMHREEGQFPTLSRSGTIE